MRVGNGRQPQIRTSWTTAAGNAFSDGDSLGQAEAEGFLYIEDYRQLIQNFQERQNDNKLLFITGSLYFIAEVRAYLTSL